jgi:transcriptional regulator with XRE-family HTH domain
MEIERSDYMNLKEQRITLGLTQAQVAVAVGVSLTGYQNWEKGLSTPSEENMKKLKKVLKIKS